MSMPTLMIKGKLVAPDGDPATQRDLNEVVPLDYIINWFQSRESKSGMSERVLILKSETASGKSTALPPAIFHAFLRGKLHKSPGIICTQPRTMTAIENINEMLKYKANSDVMRLGENIGWSTKHNKIKPDYNASLLSATIGTLTQQLSVMDDDEIMARYRFILIDETHERDLQTDATIYSLKNFLDRQCNNVACPFVVFMSATFDPTSFLEYFKIPLRTNFIWCKGEAAGFDEMWDWNDARTVNDYPRAAAECVDRIVRTNQSDPPARGDILIFMPGSVEIGETANRLRAVNEKLHADGKTIFSILKIDSESVRARSDSRDFMWTMYVPVEKQTVQIGNKSVVPSRRCIISTNVAETGITLSNLKYSIDAGFNRETEYNPIFGINSLLTKPAPQSRIVQRKGRVGRKFRGVFYPLYPIWIFDRMQVLQYPQIIVNDVSPIMFQIILEQLKVKTLAREDPVFDINTVDMLDLPSADAIATVMNTMYTLGFLAPVGGSNTRSSGLVLTEMGSLASAISTLTCERIRTVLASYFWEVSVLDVVTMMAWSYFSAKDLVIKEPSVDGKPPAKPTPLDWAKIYDDGLPGFFNNPRSIYKVRLLIGDSLIDGIIFTAAMAKVTSKSATPHSALRDWCRRMHINFKNCIEFIKRREEIMEQLVDAGFLLFESEENSFKSLTEKTLINYVTKLKYCIYEGFRGNVLTLRDGAYWTHFGLQVNVPPLFRDDERGDKYDFVKKVKPHTIVYTDLALKFNRKLNLHVVDTTGYSSMDGWVPHDAKFVS